MELKEEEKWLRWGSEGGDELSLDCLLSGQPPTTACTFARHSQ